MISKKEFDILVLLAEKKDKLSQRIIANKIGVSLGTINKNFRDLSEKELIKDGKITIKGIEALEPYRVKRAIFLAAGFGSRLVPITLNTPKPLVRVNGTRIIDTLLDAVVNAGIEEIVIVRGYLGEQFDQLLYKYPNIQFVENPFFNENNNISSAMCVRYLLQKSYVLESDLLLRNPKLIRKYEYESNFLGIPVQRTDDWYLKTDATGVIQSQGIGGTDCYQMIGISYWSADDGSKLTRDLEEVYNSPGGKERYWEQTALLYKKENYKVTVRTCNADDVVEIDTFNELKKIDKTYAI